MIPVNGHKDLFRDPKTGAILDTNTSDTQHMYPEGTKNWMKEPNWMK